MEVRESLLATTRPDRNWYALFCPFLCLFFISCNKQYILLKSDNILFFSEKRIQVQTVKAFPGRIDRQKLKEASDNASKEVKKEYSIGIW